MFYNGKSYGHRPRERESPWGCLRSLQDALCPPRLTIVVTYFRIIIIIINLVVNKLQMVHGV